MTAVKAPLVFGAFLPLLVISADTLAQSTGNEREPVASIVTDRPTDSASPELVPRRSFQLELGYKFSRFGGESEAPDTHVLPDLLARYGVSRSIEARLVATGWTFRRGDAVAGFNDISLGAKLALAQERSARPQMAVLLDVSLPVGGRGFTSDYVIPKILFLGANTLTHRLGLTYNLGTSLVTSSSGTESTTNVDLHYAVALGGSVAGPFTLFGELYGAVALGSDRVDRHSLQAGTTVLARTNLQLDLRAGIGLVANEPRWLAGVGVAFRLPR